MFKSLLFVMLCMSSLVFSSVIIHNNGTDPMDIYIGSNSYLELYGGDINLFQMRGSSTSVIHSTDSINRIEMMDSSVLDLHNGDDFILLGLFRSAKITIYGTELKYSNQIKGLNAITGFWEDDTPFLIGLNSNYKPENIAFIEVPELATFILMGLGCLLFKKFPKETEGQKCSY